MWSDPVLVIEKRGDRIVGVHITDGST